MSVYRIEGWRQLLGVRDPRSVDDQLARKVASSFTMLNTRWNMPRAPASSVARLVSKKNFLLGIPSFRFFSAELDRIRRVVAIVAVELLALY
jgi:hypothetical protein